MELNGQHGKWFPPWDGGEMPEAISLPERRSDTGCRSILSLLLISKVYYCFFLIGCHPTVGLARALPFVCAIIYFGAFLRYCFVRANNCNVINDAVKLHSLLAVDAVKLISKSFMSITPVLDLCKGTKEQKT